MSQFGGGSMASAVSRESISTCRAFDDPVPSDTVTFNDTEPGVPPSKPHSIERQVQHLLTSQPGMTFSSLVVRRFNNGVCIEGILESSEDADVCSLIRQIAGIDEVVNHLLVCRPASTKRVNKPH